MPDSTGLHLEMNEAPSYEEMKRRKTSLPESVLFGDNITINYPIPPESIPYTAIPSIALYIFSSAFYSLEIHNYLIISLSYPISVSLFILLFLLILLLK